MLFFNFSASIIKSPPSDTDEFNFDDIDALLSDLDIIDKRHKVILDDSESVTENCGNGNDEAMKVTEDFSTDPKLLIIELISETEEQENLFFNLADAEKANAASVNENTNVRPLVGHLPPLNLKKNESIIANRELNKRGRTVSAGRLTF